MPHEPLQSLPHNTCTLRATFISCLCTHLEVHLKTSRIHVYTNVRAYICIYTCINVFISVNIYIYICICILYRICIYIYITYIYIYICMNIRIYIGYICFYMYKICGFLPLVLGRQPGRAGTGAFSRRGPAGPPRGLRKKRDTFEGPQTGILVG